MSDLLDIDSITIADVRLAIREALSGAIDADALDDFVSSVDWSRVAQALPEVVAALGQVELWTREYLEDSAPAREYLTNLLSLMPASERPDLRAVALPS